jgi:transposase
MPRSKPTPKRLRWDDLPCIHPTAAGMDIGASALGVAVPPARDAEPGRVFEPCTPDLHALVAWLVACHIATVAMESTGIYWVPLFALLAQQGITPSLVKARHVKTVPGRKTDWHDAQWLQKLHMLGLWHASFRPDAERCLWRTLLRHRAGLLEPRAPHILHLPKALNLMNIPLSEVLTDITGVTGQAIRRALVHGERAPLQRAQLRNPACKSSTDDRAKALTGTWRAEQVCILQQALECFAFDTHQLAACDAQIERQLAVMKPRVERDEPLSPWPRVKPGSPSTNQPHDDARAQLARRTGVELVAVTGSSASSAQTLLAELGTDRRKCPTGKPCCSWPGLAPHHDIAGGRVLRSRTLKVVSRATPAFRQAAQAVARSASAFGAYFRAMRARLGPQQATVATAHQLARVVDHLLKYRQPFTDESAATDERQRRERELQHLGRRAHKLGYTLTPVAYACIVRRFLSRPWLARFCQEGCELRQYLRHRFCW